MNQLINCTPKAYSVTLDTEYLKIATAHLRSQAKLPPLSNRDKSYDDYYNYMGVCLLSRYFNIFVSVSDYDENEVNDSDDEKSL